MTFLNPLVLFGLIAAGIPLLIHLFNFRKPRKVDFSSLVFLRELQERTMQRVKIKQWLLLILRTLAIASLVLSFARPTLKGSIAGVLGGDAESASVLVVDNSLSMTVRDANGVLLSQALTTAEGFSELFQVGDQVAVLRTGDVGSETGRWLKTRTAVEGELKDVTPSRRTTDLSDAVAEAGRLLESTSFVNREVFVLSDFQTSTLGDSLVDFPTGVRVRLARVGSELVANTAVTDVRVASQIVEPGRPVRIEATIGASGTESTSSVLASVFLDGERTAQAEVQVPPDAEATAEFVATPRRTGWLEGWVEIEDDALESDNRRYFALAVPETRRVLLVSGPDFQPRFITLALSAEVAPGKTRFEVDSSTTSGLSSRQLTDYDVVILAGVSELSSGQISALGSYVANGGGLLLFPPTASELEGINAVLRRLGGGAIESLVGSDAIGGAIARIESADVEHPLFEGVFQTSAADDQPRLEQLDVYRLAAYRTSNAAETTLLRLSTGQSFLQEIPYGSGKALFVAALPTPDWSELPVRGLFVPLMYRSLGYLSSGESPAGDMLVIGGRVDLNLPGATETDIVRIVGGGEEIVPSQRPSFGGMLATVGSGILEPGIYDVIVGERVVRKLSANQDRRESDLRTLDAAAAAEVLRGRGSADVEAMSVGEPGGDSFASAVETMRSGVELWNVFLGVALVFLLAEMLVSRLWRPESSSA